MKRTILFLLTALVVGIAANARTVKFDFTSQSSLASLGISVPDPSNHQDLKGSSFEYGGITMSFSQEGSVNGAEIYDINSYRTNFELHVYGSTVTFKSDQPFSAITFNGRRVFFGEMVPNTWRGSAKEVSFSPQTETYIEDITFYFDQTVREPDTVSVTRALQLIKNGDTRDHYVYGIVRKTHSDVGLLNGLDYINVWLQSETNPNDTLRAYHLYKKAGAEWKTLDHLSKTFRVGNKVLIYAYELKDYVEVDSNEKQFHYNQAHVGKFCEIVPEKVVVQFYPPVGAPEEGIDIIGTFDEWKGVKLTKNSDGMYTAILDSIMPEDQFKFRQAGTWDREPTYYDANTNTWKTHLNMNFFDLWEIGAGAYSGYKVLRIDWRGAQYAWSNPPAQEPGSYSVYVGLYPPAGAPKAGIDIIGTFDEWKGVKLTKNSDGMYTTILKDIKPEDQFKFRETGTWDNQPTFYGNWFPDLTFSEYWTDEGATYGYPGYKTLLFDWRDESQFSWVNPAGADTYSVYVAFYSPSGAPDKGVEIVGNFNGWATGKKMTQEGNYYYVHLDDVAASQQFKFREVGDTEWENDLQYKDNNGAWQRFGNYTFDIWTDDVYNYHNADKYIILNLSNDTKYKWLKSNDNPPLGYSTIDMQNEWGSVQKILRDGQLYIMYKGKMYNVLGAEVR